MPALLAYRMEGVVFTPACSACKYARNVLTSCVGLCLFRAISSGLNQKVGPNSTTEDSRHQKLFNLFCQ